MSTRSFTDFPRFEEDNRQVWTFDAPGLPEPEPLEADTFDRQHMVPGHDQRALERARVVLVGAGGLNSWTALGLARCGIRNLTLIDPDWVERTNLPRQHYFSRDIGFSKARCLGKNLLSHMTAGGRIVGMAMPFQEAAEDHDIPCELLIVGVDNNACRLAAVEFARKHHIPAVISMLSQDGVRCQVFLQGPDDDDACLWCALPNLDPETSMPCAAAIISSCLMAAAFVQFFAHRALMGWPKGVEAFNWREADLLGVAPDHLGQIRKRKNCPVCTTSQTETISEELK